MLLQRVFAAILISTLLIGGMWADYYWLHTSLMLHGIFLLFTFIAFREFWVLCRAAHEQTFSVWGTLSGVVLVIAHFMTMNTISDKQRSMTSILQAQDLWYGTLAVAVMGAFWLAARRKNYEPALGALGVTCLGLVYLAFLPSFVLKIRHLGTDGLLGGEGWIDFGQKMVIATIVVAKGCDIFAYLIGKVVGRHKAFPNLSPGKTIEGVAAGLGGSLGLAFLLRWDVLGVLPSAYFSVPETCIFGLVIGLSGMMGDLTESLLKRSAGVKDAGHVIPGFGGILDVIDSLTIAGPVAYFLIPVIIAAK